ncbi:MULTISPECIES: YhcH/YjgK/YiaL family protein [Flavobacterium]|uniref:YhcH/YjgK/YiaL family protein n=1 Tax=Flavobacterium sedimenticola TaxID=3043286 RepID=A0ABT6XRJ1_9FLAO|nr:YhcH/YjgK/YiaL family protein [Flavobacterium sedimenticola]MDI9257713.1 YhcH/YjgK/YiaL family protein [Flavobacterium sedimenticola]
MITDKLENIKHYASLFSGIHPLLQVTAVKSLDRVIEKESHGDITLIPIQSNGVSATFDAELLEAHRTLMDIHITLAGTDVIAYADLQSESQESKPYDEANDYLLARAQNIKTLSVPAGYFCIIPNQFAHMALYQGHSEVKKIVVKMPAPL